MCDIQHAGVAGQAEISAARDQRPGGNAPTAPSPRAARDPARILRGMNTLLQPADEVLVSFGPTWYHPLGGRLFSEVSGGLNQMTIAKFEESIAGSSLRFASLRACTHQEASTFSQPLHARIYNSYCALPVNQTAVMTEMLEGVRRRCFYGTFPTVCAHTIGFYSAATFV